MLVASKLMPVLVPVTEMKQQLRFDKDFKDVWYSKTQEMLWFSNNESNCSRNRHSNTLIYGLMMAYCKPGSERKSPRAIRETDLDSGNRYIPSMTLRFIKTSPFKDLKINLQWLYMEFVRMQCSIHIILYDGVIIYAIRKKRKYSIILIMVYMCNISTFLWWTSPVPPPPKIILTENHWKWTTRVNNNIQRKDKKKNKHWEPTWSIISEVIWLIFYLDAWYPELYVSCISDREGFSCVRDYNYLLCKIFLETASVLLHYIHRNVSKLYYCNRT